MFLRLYSKSLPSYRNMATQKRLSYTLNGRPKISDSDSDGECLGCGLFSRTKCRCILQRIRHGDIWFLDRKHV
jgi:hypothetical protein